MNSPSEDIANILVAQGVSPGVGSTTAWSIYVSREPVEPDSVLTIYDTGADRFADEVNEIYHPTIQVRARSTDYRGAWSKLEAVRDKLLAIRNLVEGNTEYVALWAPNGITAIGFDQNERAILVQNFNITRVTT